VERLLLSAICLASTTFHSVGPARIVQKQLGLALGLDRLAPKAVESRHARYMLRREGTLLDPTVGGGAGGAPLLQNFRFLISKRHTFVNC